MLTPVTARIGRVWSVPTDGSTVVVEMAEGDRVPAAIVGALPNPGTTVLLLSTYDRLYCLGSVGGLVPDVPTLPPIDPAAGNAIEVSEDGALMVSQWIRHGTHVATLDGSGRTTIVYDRMPEPLDPDEATVIVGFGDGHRTISGPVLPLTAGRTRDSFVVEVVGGAGSRVRLNWLIAARIPTREESDGLLAELSAADTAVR